MVWDLRSCECVTTLAGHTNGVWCLHFEGENLASGSYDNSIRYVSNPFLWVHFFFFFFFPSLAAEIIESGTSGLCCRPRS